MPTPMKKIHSLSLLLFIFLFANVQSKQNACTKGNLHIQNSPREDLSGCFEVIYSNEQIPENTPGLLEIGVLQTDKKTPDYSISIRSDKWYNAFFQKLFEHLFNFLQTQKSGHQFHSEISGPIRHFIGEHFHFLWECYPKQNLMIYDIVTYDTPEIKAGPFTVGKAYESMIRQLDVPTDTLLKYIDKKPDFNLYINIYPAKENDEDSEAVKKRTIELCIQYDTIKQVNIY